MRRWKRLRFAVAGAAAGLALAQLAPARAEPQAGPPSLTGAGADSQPSKVEARPSGDSLCRALARAAADNGLPVAFLTRLIWLEHVMAEYGLDTPRMQFDPGGVRYEVRCPLSAIGTQE